MPEKKERRPYWEIVMFAGMCVLNIVVFLRIGLQTLVPPVGLLELFGFFILFAFIFTRDQEYRQRSFISLCMAPFALNAVLLVNYVFSVHPITERYPVTFNYQVVNQGKLGNAKVQRSTLIRLEGGAYEAYPGIRVFWDFEKIHHAKHITYTFKKGLFGIRVMTDYKIN